MGNNIHPFFPENPPNFLPFPPEKEKTRSKETQFAVSANPPSSCEQRTQKRDHPPTYFWRPDTHTAITRNLLRNLTTTPNPSFSPFYISSSKFLCKSCCVSSPFSPLFPPSRVQTPESDGGIATHSHVGLRRKGALFAK